MPQNDWLVVFLIYVDQRASGFKNSIKIFEEQEKLLSDLKSCTINENTKVLIILNSIAFKLEGSPQSLEDYTYIIEVIPEKGCSRNSFVNIKTIDNNDSKYPDIGKPHKVQQLAGVFNVIKNNCDNRYDAKNIFLNTWDHGSIFGIFKETEVVPKRSIVDFPIESFPLTKELFSNLKVENKNNLSGLHLYDILMKNNREDDNLETQYLYKGRSFTTSHEEGLEIAKLSALVENKDNLGKIEFVNIDDQNKIKNKFSGRSVRFYRA